MVLLGFLIGVSKGGVGAVGALLTTLLSLIMPVSKAVGVLVPLFIVLTDVPLAARPGSLLLIAALGNVGFAAVGTLVSGLTCGLRHRGGLLALLLLPLVIPVVFGAAEATRMMLSGQIDSLWWRWIQLLAVFAGVFTVLGAMMFEFIMEE